MDTEEMNLKIQQLQSELEKSHKDHQDYLEECKALEELLESENQKKEAEIKKLKTEALSKEKAFRSAQTEAAEHIKDLQTKNKQIAQLTEKLGKYTQGSSEGEEKLKVVEEKLKGVEESLVKEQGVAKERLERVTQLEKEVAEGKQREKERADEIENLKNQILGITNASEEKSEQINSLNSQLESLKASSKSPSKIKDDRSSGKKPPQETKVESKDNSAQLSKLKLDHTKALKEIANLKAQLSKSRENQARISKKQLEGDSEECKRLEKTCRELKQRVAQLTEEKNMFQQSSKAIDFRMSSKQLLPESRVSKGKSVFFSVFLTTKKHYVSPFFQFNGKVIRVLKQNRNSFEKCLGSLKFTVDSINYDAKQHIENILNNITIPQFKRKQTQKQELNVRDEPQDINEEYQSEDAQRRTVTILILGAKNTSKQVLFSQAISRFIEKLKQSQEQLQDIPIRFNVYRNRVNQLPADVNEEIELTGSQIEEEYNTVVSLLKSKEESGKKKILTKEKEKPRNQVRYFAVEVGSKLKVEFISSSNVSQIRESDKLPTSLENVAFHHLPYESDPDREIHCILTLNPIVQQYQNVRLCLSLVNQIQSEKREEPDFEIASSPVKDQFISQSIKKRMQSCQKETEQHSIRVQKMQNEIQFYRNRIEQILLRVKNTISLQGKNSPYLKKSPVVLTLEKLEKSLLGIMQRSQLKMKRVEGNERYEEYEEGGEYQEEGGENQDQDDLL